MKHLSTSVFTATILLAACSSDDVGTGRLPASEGGATGGASSGGATSSGGAGTQCQTTADCPQLGCFMCPARVCVNGRCESPGPIGTGGSPGTGGSSGGLKWFTTCGPPVCQAPSGSGGRPPSGLPTCVSSEQPGSPCSVAGAHCDTGAACSGPLECATSDPTNGGQCPVSRATYKTNIEYVSSDERAKLAQDVESIPLVRYRYKEGSERQHLGFIIEDVEPSPGVDSANDRVDVYGYTSMAVAALQEQHREIEALKREVAELRATLAESASGSNRRGSARTSKGQ